MTWSRTVTMYIHHLKLRPRSEFKCFWFRLTLTLAFVFSSTRSRLIWITLTTWAIIADQIIFVIKLNIQKLQIKNMYHHHYYKFLLHWMNLNQTRTGEWSKDKKISRFLALHQFILSNNWKELPIDKLKPCLRFSVYGQ